MAGLKPGFTGGTLDRADAVRQDPAALAAATADVRARLLRLTMLEPEIDGEGKLVWTTLADIDADAEPVLLGFDDRRIPHFAQLSPSDRSVTTRSPNMMRIMGLMPDHEAANYAAARSLIDWHSRHRFCAVCGTPTVTAKAGWARSCPACGAEHFPRTDPVVIMLAVHRDRLLLGRGKGWSEGRYSALAGFVEVGETVEEAVARETFEEAGVRVENIRYMASQPWPFPSSLMIGCIADAVDDALNVDPNELDDALWFTRDQVRAAMAGEPGAAFLTPPRFAIAHTLIARWLAGDVPAA